MTKRLPFTQHSLKRAIAAAQDAGLQVAAIKADGTLLVHSGDDPPPAVSDGGQTGDATRFSKWEDVEA